MMRIFSRLLIPTISFLLSHTIQAQDTLPVFNAYRKANGQADILWLNDYGVVKQITVQRSSDSLKRFMSVYSSPNPMAKKGNFTDVKTNGYQYYYRIYIQLPEGKYFYTASQKAIPYPSDSMQAALNGTPGSINISDPGKKLKNPTTPIVPKPPVFMPSDYVFSDKKGNIIINLPDAENKKYSIVFRNDQQQEIMRISRVKESNLVLERANFYKSGWYYFEIYEGEQLFEKHKVLLGKE
ncbi:MAG: hypothetical protein JNM68_10915 [Dinghuibacter sp.]|nr:hypothetical protein [Dinghuibacter sp.]